MKLRMGLFLITVSLLIGAVSFVHAQDTENVEARPYSCEHGSCPGEFANIDDITLFLAEDREHGRELWRSDGTEKGTHLVKDIFPGSGSSAIIPFGVMDDTFYFAANNGVDGNALWKSGGKENSTIMIKTMDQTVITAGAPIAAMGDDTFYFFAFGGHDNWSLWVSDGSAYGTQIVRDGFKGGPSSIPSSLTLLNDQLYFESYFTLWKSGGTPDATIALAGPESADSISVRGGFAVKNSELYFTGTGKNHLISLYKTDGSLKGTRHVKTIGENRNDFIRSLKSIHGVLYFDYTHANGTSRAFWRSDGTSEGTIALKKIGVNFSSFASLNGNIFFQGYDDSHGWELWKSNGTKEGTVLLKDILSGEKHGRPRNFTVFKGSIYFLSSKEYEKNKWHDVLWISDGTEEGTVPVFDKIVNYKIYDLIKAGKKLLYSATDWSHGAELWGSDGTEKGTMIVKDIKKDSLGSRPKVLYRNGQLLFYTAEDEGIGRELWISDGTIKGTRFLKDINKGIKSSRPSVIAYHNRILYFSANEDELWRSDGTPDGTLLIKKFSTGLATLNHFRKEKKNEKSAGREKKDRASRADFMFESLPFYLVADDGKNGWELWRSDGTASGTFMMKDINKEGNSFPYLEIYADEKLYFQADDGKTGRELWVSDGTEKGTRLLKDIEPGKGSSGGYHFTSASENLYFTSLRYDEKIQGFVGDLWGIDRKSGALNHIKQLCMDCYMDEVPDPVAINNLLFYILDEPEPSKLWVTDGTEKGTVQLHEGDRFHGLKNHNGRLAFFNIDNKKGLEFWSSDGTQKGTQFIKNIEVTTVAGSAWAGTIELNGTPHILTLDRPYHGEEATCELWKTDGTEKNTLKVGHFKFESRDVRWTLSNNTLYISVISKNHMEIWTSDGSQNGTSLLKRFKRKPHGLFDNPHIIPLNDTTVFIFNHEETGRELWRTDGTIDGTFRITGEGIDITN